MSSSVGLVNDLTSSDINATLLRFKYASRLDKLNATFDNFSGEEYITAIWKFSPNFLTLKDISKQKIVLLCDTEYKSIILKSCAIATSLKAINRGKACGGFAAGNFICAN